MKKINPKSEFVEVVMIFNHMDGILSSRWYFIAWIIFYCLDEISLPRWYFIYLLQ